jgi:predicted acyl esterase
VRDTRSGEEGASIRLLPARQAPRRVSMVERRSWIPIGDGVRLAASLYLPEAVEAGDAAPVVLEALPYRKDDVTASFRAEYERLCAAYGYAVARADLRGIGSSEGWPPTSTRRVSRPTCAG